MPDQPQTKHWAIVELFGHQRLAGEISEYTLGGASFVRVDVPPVGETPGFTTLKGPAAIYGITFVDEAVARAAAESYKIKPVSAYEIPALRQAQLFHETSDDFDLRDC